MNTRHFFAGLALGATLATLFSKKICSKICPACAADTPEATENTALKDAEEAVETLRNSVDSLRNELNSRIESEQTYAAECEDLKAEVGAKNAEIETLKNICEKQDGQNKKLEEELAQAKSN